MDRLFKSASTPTLLGSGPAAIHPFRSLAAACRVAWKRLLRKPVEGRNRTVLSLLPWFNPFFQCRGSRTAEMHPCMSRVLPNAASAPSSRHVYGHACHRCTPAQCLAGLCREPQRTSRWRLPWHHACPRGRRTCHPPDLWEIGTQLVLVSDRCRPGDPCCEWIHSRPGLGTTFPRYLFSVVPCPASPPPGGPIIEARPA